MKITLSPTVFMVAYSVVYCATLTADLPAFRYYPLTGVINWGPGRMEGIGPAMAWYGILANAAVAGLVSAFVVPGGWLTKVMRNFLWIIPLSAMIVCVYLMRGFFL